jgi:hypothetical protein
MLVTKKSNFTGIEHTLDIPVTEEQMKAWQDGELIQKAMPELSSEQREFLMTGVTPEEWAQFIVEED